ncbi:MAG: nucleoside-diphosphate kinase [Candidatus Gottesmanbacteria bacterium]|nr:nucleoside-diphosphate kinase [Candidatus Gottesmanbacteria bacterium]
MIQQTVVLIKPDGYQKKVVGQVIDRFERAGLSIIGLKLVQLTQEILDIWYAHHKGKPFYPSVCEQMMSTPVVAIVLEGEGAVEKVFGICGPTDPAEAPVGTIRKDFGVDKPHNVVHRSDSVEAAAKEIGLLFADGEIFKGV